MEEKYKKFKEFNWQESNEWQSYYRNLYPTPPGSKILKYKKKFYRLKIDPDFDVDYIPPEENDSSSTSSSSYSSYNNTQNNYSNQQPNFTTEQTFETYRAAQSLANPINSPLLTKVETLFFVLFIVSLPFRYKTTLLAIIAFAVRSIHLVGIPQFNLNYLQALLMNDSFHSLVFVAQTLIDRFNYYMIVPVGVSAVIALSENIKATGIKIGNTEKMIDSVIKGKETLIQDKTHIEVAIGFIAVLGIFLKINSILTPIIYWQMMKVRYTLNPYLKQSFKELNQVVEGFKNSGKCPAPVKFVIEKMQWAFTYMGQVNAAANQQNGQGNNQGVAAPKCTIF